MSRPTLLAGHGELGSGRPYLQRAELKPGWHDRVASALDAALAQPVRARLASATGRLRRIVAAVAAHEPGLHGIDDAELAARALALRPRLRRDGYSLAHAGACFALIREAAGRSLGRRHYDTQLMAGWAMLQGRLVEMATGEGKTLSATLPACSVALAGHPVVVVTVNDYLARRDAQELAPLYRALGLTVGAVVQGMDSAARRAAYACSVTYCTNKELAFDYLRDGVALARRSSGLHLALDRLHGTSGDSGPAPLVLRGLCFAIVDEADSVFIDEARTPLILSRSVAPEREAQLCNQALALARELTEREHYTVDRVERRIVLTERGEQRVDREAEGRDGVWTSERARDELIVQALGALLLYRRDEQYVVHDGKVQIVDESTGRVMPDRSWEQGLHQMIEAKEACELTPRSETLARLTYQRLFRRYLRLCGMSGTAREARTEIARVYQLDTVRIPLHRPNRRRVLPPRLMPTSAAKWQCVADAVQRIAGEQRRPVLIGTRSVQASEQISAVLRERGIEHALLNAKQDRDEAEVIARAGRAGHVTVATNMAGRGTDIRLEAEVAERGGLHVILTEFHESPRIDRQLFGRCARQGDPGSCQAIVSLEDEIFRTHAPAATRALAALARRRGSGSAAGLGLLRWLAQSAAERRAASTRWRNLESDRKLEQTLAFAGKGE